MLYGYIATSDTIIGQGSLLILPLASWRIAMVLVTSRPFLFYATYVTWLAPYHISSHCRFLIETFCRVP